MAKAFASLRGPAFAVLIAAISAAGAGTLAADTYEDKLISTPGTPDVVAKGLEADGYALGILAYTWGYPLVRMERVARSYTDVPLPKPTTSYRAPLNKIGWATELATPDAKDMPTANNDTYYMSAVVKLDQPYILSVPDTHDRYYVVNVFNMWQELEHYIGRRTRGTKAGRYAIVPPKWSGKLPDDVVRLDVTTDKVWLWGRLHIAQGEPVEPVHRCRISSNLSRSTARRRRMKLFRPCLRSRAMSSVFSSSLPLRSSSMRSNRRTRLCSRSSRGSGSRLRASTLPN